MADLCFRGWLCGHKELHLSVLSTRNGQGAVGLQVEVLLASNMNLPYVAKGNKLVPTKLDLQHGIPIMALWL